MTKEKDSGKGALTSIGSYEVTAAEAIADKFEEIDAQIVHADQQLKLALADARFDEKFLGAVSSRLQELIKDKEGPRTLIKEARAALAEARKALQETKELRLELPFPARAALEMPEISMIEGGEEDKKYEGITRAKTPHSHRS